MSRFRLKFSSLLNLSILFICSFSFTSHGVAETRLYGGTGQNPIFLGCFGEQCGSVHPDSICNLGGVYGLNESDLSMWNESSFYGNEYRKASIWNKGSAGLTMTDSQRTFLGRLKVTQEVPSNTISAILGSFYYDSGKNLLNTRSKFCEFLEH